jgi:hypothetical protein
MAKPENTHFAVYYNKEVEVIKVEGPDGNPVPRVELSKNPLQNVDGLTCTLVIHKPGQTPCCIVHGGWEWCWCGRQAN